MKCDAIHLRADAVSIEIVQATRRGVTVMVKGLKFAAVSAIFLFPFVYPHSAVARTYLSYQEAVWLCGAGDLEACDAMNAYEAAPPGIRRGPLNTHDFIR
jgi:hypothetical protein